MKKLFFAMMAIVALFATSCQKENFGEETTVSFNIGTPEIATRAYSDGTTAAANALQYAVYEVKSDNSLSLLSSLNGTATFTDLKALVQLKLTTGKTYSVIFWAAAQGAPYSVNFGQTGATMTVDYTNVVSNNETLDAFYKCHTFEVRGAQTETVELRRPFVQLNIGTNDYTESTNAGFTPTQSKVVVKSINKTLNLVDGSVANSVDVTFGYNAIATGEKFPVDGYNYLAMNYLLVDAEPTVIEVEFSYATDAQGANEKSRKVGSVPVQRNHRTNIYGSLLTSGVDFNVEIKPEYDKDDNNVEAPTIVAVSTKEQLANVFENGGSAILTDDIEFEKIVAIEPGAEVYLNLNGKTITVDQSTTSNTLMYVKEGAKLTIDGNGIIDLQGVSTMAIFAPYGELVIENGTFIRNEVETVTNKTTGLFMGAKTIGSNVTINGGYFDAGYYNTDAADIEEILAGTKTLEETADDIAKRGNSKDANKVRVALKDNVSALLNHSGYGSFKIYGGTFVGANPAWGDEGCMLPTTPNYLRPWSYYQGALLDGQEFNEDGIVLPSGYAITKDTHKDGRPTYTVTYNK